MVKCEVEQSQMLLTRWTMKISLEVYRLSGVIVRKLLALPVTYESRPFIDVHDYSDSSVLRNFHDLSMIQTFLEAQGYVGCAVLKHAVAKRCLQIKSRKDVVLFTQLQMLGHCRTQFEAPKTHARDAS